MKDEIISIKNAERNKAAKAEGEMESLAKFPSENPNPVLRISKDGKILYSNKASEQLLSRWNSDIGKTVPEKWCNLITKAFASGKTQEEEEEEEEVKIFSITITPIKETGYANLYASDITERKKAEEALLAKTYNLTDRVKELNCLYGVTHLVETPNLSQKELCQGIVALILPAWQYPEITCARIIFEGQEFKSDNFRETEWTQTADIVFHGKPSGIIQVCYLEERQEEDEGSFFKEERNLINALAERLGKIIEHNKAEETLRIERDNLKNIFEAVKDGIYIVNQQYDIQYVNPVLIKDFGVYEGRKCYEYFHDQTEVCPWCRSHDVFAGKTVRWEWYSFKNQKTYDLIDTPLKNPNGSISKLEIFRDITERKQAEKQVLEYQKQLQQMGSKIAMAEERQRRQIATILHDNIGQDMALSMLKLDTLKKSASSKDVIAGLDEVNKTIEKTVQDTRTLSFDLSSPILHRFGFVRAIEQWISEQVRKRHGIKTRFIKNRKIKQLDEDTSVVLYQATREVLINVIKHAQAKSVEVSVNQIDGEIEVIVKDDGVGFEISEIGQFLHENGGFGLFNVSERLNYFGGDIRIESKPENGTMVALTIPAKVEKNDGV